MRWATSIAQKLEWKYRRHTEIIITITIAIILAIIKEISSYSFAILIVIFLAKHSILSWFGAMVIGSENPKCIFKYSNQIYSGCITNNSNALKYLTVLFTGAFVELPLILIFLLIDWYLSKFFMHLRLILKICDFCYYDFECFVFFIMLDLIRWIKMKYIHLIKPCIKKTLAILDFVHLRI